MHPGGAGLSGLLHGELFSVVSFRCYLSAACQMGPALLVSVVTPTTVCSTSDLRLTGACIPIGDWPQ